MKNDALVIEKLGGITKVAKLLNLKNPGGARRVCNWKRRGIPAAIKLEFPQYFQESKKMVLPYDICRCMPMAKECAKKYECSRFMATKIPDVFQSHFDYSVQLKQGKDCIYMIRENS
jgi:hypothetical protein